MTVSSVSISNTPVEFTSPDKGSCQLISKVSGGAAVLLAVVLLSPVVVVLSLVDEEKVLEEMSVEVVEAPPSSEKQVLPTVQLHNVKLSAGHEPHPQPNALVPKVVTVSEPIDTRLAHPSNA